MTNYLCNNCNYKFTSAKTEAPKSCPYCGAVGTVRGESSASDLLREVEETGE
mgnify:CR=1 FL=1